MPHDEDVQPRSLADVLRDFRGDMPQEDLAARIGVSPGLIGHAERGKRSLGVDKIDRIAGVLNLTPEQHAELRAARDRQSDLLSSKRRGPGVPEWAPLEAVDELASQLAGVEAVVRAQARVTRLLGDATLNRVVAFDELVARLNDLEQALAAQQAH